MRLGDSENAYDLVVVGGGITGAGVFARAVAMGLRTLLVEQQDFSWGTSSRSSKMVHGGLRYLKQGKLLLTRDAVRERERLLRAYPGLVTPLNFLLPIYRGRGPSRAAMIAGLNIYSFLAGEKQHRHFTRAQVLDCVPEINSRELSAAMGFRDAQVDDARLVLRLIFDAVDLGGHALNYTRAAGLCRDSGGRIRAVGLEDPETGLRKEIGTRAVVNATGAFAEVLHPSPVKGLHIRPLRGSHLIFPGTLMDLDRVVSFLHPRDLRPVFLFPWQGALVLGTTDVDHAEDLSREPGISEDEAAYLVEGVREVFPDRGFDPDKALSAISGIRPVLSRGKKKSASGESREHVIWVDRGLVTVTGGKLTTFDLLARDALKAASAWLPDATPRESVAASRAPSPGLAPELFSTLRGRLGGRLAALSEIAAPETFCLIPGTRTCWAELIHGAVQEEVRHLTDLLLRRVRIGLLLPGGGMGLMDEIRSRVSPHLDWDDNRWAQEIRDYGCLWRQTHAPGPHRRSAGFGREALKT